MSAETSHAGEVHLIVGFDGSGPAVRALDTAVRLLSARPPGKITVTWVAHLSGAVELSADATAIMESDFDQVAAEIRAEAAKQLDGSGLSWDFQWRQGLIAQELIAVAESVQAEQPEAVTVILVGSSSSAMHRVVGSVAVTLAHHSPVPITVVP
jgi:nucleotide-binding universal stress UspA family protein